MAKNTLGFKLKLLRVSQALTQEELADAIGVNRITICLWENNKSKPTMKLKRKIAEFYGVPTKELR